MPPSQADLFTTPKRHPELPNLQITAQEWQWAENLIRDVEEEERKGVFAAVFFSWKMVLRQFRKLETKTFTQREPAEIEMAHHCACVTALISIGHFLKLEASKDPEEKAKTLGISIGEIDAHLFELKTAYEEWHADAKGNGAAALEQRIFCGTP